MSTAQSLLFFLILMGVAATMLRLVSRSTPTVPYPVLLAGGGIVIGLVPGVHLPPISAVLSLLGAGRPATPRGRPAQVAAATAGYTSSDIPSRAALTSTPVF